jgi:aspartyl-tRNA(Asn)/glutamyl-tRNA(Gln) amidotransferase subunit A
MASLASLTLSEMRAGLDSKKFSARELAQASLAAAEKHRDLNSFIAVCGEQALKDAEQADVRLAAGERAPLLGVPVAVKDMILTKGVKTTAASKILENFIPPYSATVVERIEQAGGVIVGKTNLDEFAMGSSNETSCYGPVKNPWDTSRVPGGSSGGSAAAVAAGIVPLSLGTDTGGSIRQPASLCGIVGIKPTYGRVSRYGVIAYASSLDQVGPFARNVRDAASLLNVISGKCAHDATTSPQPVPDYTAALGKSIKGLRIGLPKEYFIPGMNREVEASVRKAIASLESLGAEIVDISLPHTEHALATYYIIAPAEASSNLSRYDGIRFGHRAKNTKSLKELYAASRTEGFGREVRRRILIGTHVLSTGYYDAFYLRAQKVRSLIAQDFTNAFATSCDVIACPASPTTAFPIGDKTADPLEMYLSDVFTLSLNLAGLPGMCQPCGFDSQGLPIGLQLIGKPLGEESLLSVASAYESATSWHTQTPKIFG